MPPSFTVSDIEEGYRCFGITLQAPCILCVGWFGFLFLVSGALFTAFEFSIVQDAADLNPTFQSDFWGSSAGSKEVKVSMLRVVGPTMLALGFIMVVASFVLCCLAYRGSQKVHYPPPPANYGPIRTEDEYVRRKPAPRQYEPLQTKDNMNITSSTTPPTTETPQGSPFSTRKQAESTTDTSYHPHDTSYPRHDDPDTPPRGSPYGGRRPGSMAYSDDLEYDYSKPSRKEIGV